MDREQVITTLRTHEPELKAAGIRRGYVFGSVARGDAGANSDVDRLAEFDDARGPSTLMQMARLQNRLSDLLGAPVDLTEKRLLKDRVLANADREAVVVFLVI
jgi:predicted nucleotidyltransferase